MYDLVVLGGGAGGLNVATAAARMGAKVALVEKHKLGGECTHFACVPSKALIHAARLAHQARTAGPFGVRGDVAVNFAAVMGRVRDVVASFAGSDSGEGLRAKGIDVYRGSPAFEAYDTVIVDGATRLDARRFVIATGSRPALPNVPGLAEVGFLDNVSLWELEELPPSLVVIGAGPVGIEFAQAFARLGTEVTVLADSDQILPREDPEVADRLRSLLAAEGVTIHLNAEATGVATRDGRKVCTYRVGADEFPREVAATHLLVATGRRANVEGLNLEAVGIRADSERGIEVDDYLQTRTRHIWAIGDVLGHDQYTHAAERQAAVVVQNALLGLSRRMDYAAMPRVTFTDPELASVGVLDVAGEGGVMARDLASRGRGLDWAGRLVRGDDLDESRVFRASYEDLDRARIDGRTEGFAKLLASPSGKILGATVLGPEAGTVLQEFVLAMEHGLTLADLARAVHSYPTYSGLARKLANQYVADRLGGGLVRTALRWFYGFQTRAEPEPVDGGEDDAEARDATAVYPDGHDQGPH